jgi:hypothetical protein
MIRALGQRTVRAGIEDSMDRDSGVITLPKLRMWLRPDGIVQVVLAARAALGLEDGHLISPPRETPLRERTTARAV